MAVSLGKRKRPTDATEKDASVEDEDAVRALFQRAFESKFKALPQAPPPLLSDSAGDEDQDEAEDDDWSGISDDEHEDAIELHHHESAPLSDAATQSLERKMFMSSKPPTTTAGTKTAARKAAQTPAEDAAEANNLKHDLALQRLLKESHLLHPDSFTPNNEPTSTGKSRLSALDLRLKDLGAKTSASEQSKMPLSHRRGIVAKAAGREVRRRKDAVENGIVLEKARHAVKAQKRRERGVGAPGMGKFRGGTLKIRERDVKALQGGDKKRKGRR